MLQNLIVEPEHDKKGRTTGYYLVTAGEGRRLAQLLRAKRREIAKTEPIRCVIDTEHSAEETPCTIDLYSNSQFETGRLDRRPCGLGPDPKMIGMAATTPEDCSPFARLPGRGKHVWCHDGEVPHETGMVVDRIVSEMLPGDTGAVRLAQVGLFILIFVLEGDRAPVTAARLAELTGQSMSQVQKQLQKLVEVGVIERKRAGGRGHRFHIVIKHTKETKRLLEAMRKAAGRMQAHIGR